MSEKITGAEALLRSIEAEGVDTIFGYPGGAIIPVFDRLYDHGSKLNHILVRHEQGAVHAADAYSLRWRVGDAELGIDTAPTHPALATRPNHLHRADGTIVADPLTRTAASPTANLAAVLRALAADPGLADGAAS